jgi:hypothetical protein
MSQSTPGGGATRAPTPPPDPGNASTAKLLGDLSDQISRLVRDEVRLAQAEVAGKAGRLKVGAGLFGGAGLVALLGLNAVVAAVLVAIAAVLALVGRKDVTQAAPPLPTETIESLRTDVATVKARAYR